MTQPSFESALSLADLELYRRIQSEAGPSRLTTAKATALRSFYAAAAMRDVTPVKVAMVADSIQEGDGVADYYRRPQSLLADRLLAHWPIPGMTTQGQQMIGGWQENGTSHPAPMTITGVNNTDYLRTQLGPARRGLQIKTTAAVWAMSGPRQVAAFDVVIHKNSSGGTANVRVDGASVGTINCNAAAATYSTRTRFTVTPGAHTVSIVKDAVSSGASTVNLIGVILYETAESAAKGFHVLDAAHSGYTVGDFIATSGGVTGIGADLAALDPDLIVISLGANDEEAVEGISPDQFYADLGTLMGYRDLCPKKPGIVLMPVWKRGNVDQATHTAFVAKQYQRQAEDPRNAILDLNLHFPAIADGANPPAEPLTYRGFFYDNVHPTNVGASFLADVLARYLAPTA